MLRQAVEMKAKATALTLFLKYVLPVLLGLGLIFSLVFLIVFMMDAWVGERYPEFEGGLGRVSADVLRWQPLVEQYAMEYDVEEYVPVLLAMMMQESGGRGNDPMQASESYCGRRGCISDPELSIQQGVQYFAKQLERAQGDVRLAVQSYNFGGGFIDYVLERGGRYTFELAVEFSRMMFERLKHTGLYSCIRPNVPAGACYGDVFYVESVMSYVHFASVPAGGSGSWALPVAGGLTVTSPFGWREHPVHGDTRHHNGVDFGCIEHVTPIYAVDHGTVVYSAFNRGGYGHTVIVQHGHDLFSQYSHLSSRSVTEGQNVKQGQRIGVCGNTGTSTGAHLHLEAKTAMWDGHFDPMTLLGGRAQ